MDDDRKTFKHPSYGMIKLSRVSSNPGIHLYDSPVKHQGYLELSICEGHFDWDLSQKWMHDGPELIRVALSEAQFAAFITRPNLGSGVPCTLTRVKGDDGKYALVERPPSEEAPRQAYTDEVRDKLGKLRNAVHTFTKAVGEVTSKRGTLSAKDRKVLQGQARKIQYVLDNLPFIQTQFAEAMEKVESDVKVEIEASMNQVVRQAGLEALTAKGLLELPESLALGDGKAGEEVTARIPYEHLEGMACPKCSQAGLEINEERPGMHEDPQTYVCCPVCGYRPDEAPALDALPYPSKGY